MSVVGVVEGLSVLRVGLDARLRADCTDAPGWVLGAVRAHQPMSRVRAAAWPGLAAAPELSDVVRRFRV